MPHVHMYRYVHDYELSHARWNTKDCGNTIEVVLPPVRKIYQEYFSVWVFTNWHKCCAFILLTENGQCLIKGCKA
ncbi:hypothetical protein XELAEV_18018555mg [Xenopus laevis]|uniref:Uncharacterized protein n=1 Tax=Xenopus laevis TaxID=8355 RepID=A0A974HU29_XENLA|nr:hypothetical protein XELAEV_18018555mg [Xenopus laevis]